MARALDRRKHRRPGASQQPQGRLKRIRFPNLSSKRHNASSPLQPNEFAPFGCSLQQTPGCLQRRRPVPNDAVTIPPIIQFRRFFALLFCSAAICLLLPLFPSTQRKALSAAKGLNPHLRSLTTNPATAPLLSTVPQRGTKRQQRPTDACHNEMPIPTLHLTCPPSHGTHLHRHLAFVAITIARKTAKSRHLWETIRAIAQSNSPKKPMTT